jgi:hypothetical protein
MTNTAAAPVQRKSVRMFTIVLSLDLSNLDRVLDWRFCGIVRFHSSRNNEFVGTPYGKDTRLLTTGN